MRFTIKGLFIEKVYEITWENGKLIGDPHLIYFIERIAKASERYYGPPTGAYNPADIQTDPLAFIWFLREEIFEEILEAIGDLPESDLPKDIEA